MLIVTSRWRRVILYGRNHLAHEPVHGTNGLGVIEFPSTDEPLVGGRCPQHVEKSCGGSEFSIRQQPHPPLLVGGNSRRAIRRAVVLGDGWNPFLTSIFGIDVATTRTAAISGEKDLIAAISYMKEHCEKVGRATMPDVVLGGIVSPGEQWTPGDAGRPDRGVTENWASPLQVWRLTAERGANGATTPSASAPR